MIECSPIYFPDSYQIYIEFWGVSSLLLSSNFFLSFYSIIHKTYIFLVYSLSYAQIQYPPFYHGWFDLYLTCFTFLWSPEIIFSDFDEVFAQFFFILFLKIIVGWIVVFGYIPKSIYSFFGKRILINYFESFYFIFVLMNV